MKPTARKSNKSSMLLRLRLNIVAKTLINTSNPEKAADITTKRIDLFNSLDL